MESLVLGNCDIESRSSTLRMLQLYWSKGAQSCECSLAACNFRASYVVANNDDDDAWSSSPSLLLILWLNQLAPRDVTSFSFFFFFCLSSGAYYSDGAGTALQVLMRRQYYQMRYVIALMVEAHVQHDSVWPNSGPSLLISLITF